MRVATIDIGTNTVLLLVAERREDGALVAIDERATITRLGEGVDKARKFAPAAIARTEACLRDYAEAVRALGVDRIAIVGTSAMRDAEGGEELRAGILASFGVAPRVVSGPEEARLTFRGAVLGLPVDLRSNVAVFDIGGGSTEVVVGRMRDEPREPVLEYAHSFDVGSVRLTERHVRSDPPSSAERAELLRAATEAFRGVPPLPSGRPPAGIAGTVTTLAAVAMGMAVYDGARVHGRSLARRDLEKVVGDLAAMPLDARRKVAGMEPKRADVIVAGGVITLALLDHWGASELLVSDRGVRWGLAEELASAS